MKFSISLLPLAILTILAFTLNACASDVTRRELYSPTKGKGYWTNKLHEREKREGIFGLSHNDPYQLEGDSGIFGFSHNDRR